MLSPSQERLLHRLCRIYRLMLLAYPSTFRREYSREMVVVFRTQARDVMRSEGGWGQLEKHFPGKGISPIHVPKPAPWRTLVSAAQARMALDQCSNAKLF